MLCNLLKAMIQLLKEGGGGSCVLNHSEINPVSVRNSPDCVKHCQIKQRCDLLLGVANFGAFKLKFGKE